MLLFTELSGLVQKSINAKIVSSSLLKLFFLKFLDKKLEQSVNVAKTGLILLIILSGKFFPAHVFGKEFIDPLNIFK